jgi:hypothetical protein
VEQVLRFDVRIVVTHRRTLGVGKSLLKFRRKFIEAHSFPAIWR